MRATTLLRNDHAAVKALFRAYERAAKADGNGPKKAVFDRIAATLEAHMMVEEEILYPAIKAEADEHGVDEIAEDHDEHAVVKILLAQLLKMKPSDRIFDAKVAVLIASMEHHAEEEETVLFPEAEKILGARRLEELGALIELRRGELVGSR